MTFLRQVPLPIAVGALAAVSLGGVYSLDRLGWGPWSLIAIVVAVAAALVYLYEYNKDAPEPVTPASTPEPKPEDDTEPFDDPVAEADQLDRMHATVAEAIDREEERGALENAAQAPENLIDPTSSERKPAPAGGEPAPPAEVPPR